MKRSDLRFSLRPLTLALLAALPQACAATRSAGSVARAVADTESRKEVYAVAIGEGPAEPAQEAPAAVAGSSGENAAAEMARKLQNPLANIRALMTDNAIGFNTGTDGGTSFGFQLQPVYAVDFPERGFTFLPRAVVPIMGLEPGTDAPPVGQPVPPGDSRVWGVGDTVVQAIVAPHTDSKWKWGIGPQVSLGTATDARLRGADWGAGIAGIITGEITPDVAFAGIVGNMWSFDGSFNTALVHPMLFYNFASLPGSYVGYNAPWTADWEASSGNTWTIPLGFTLGRAVDLGGGRGLDIGIGPYYNVERPDGAADWVVRFGITLLFP